MNKIALSVLVLIFCATTMIAQEMTTIKEINDQVWKPFIRAFCTGDDEGFKSVHSKDVVRVIQDVGQVQNYNEYFKKVPDSTKAKWSDWEKNIELRFIQRISSGGNAFEVGYYKTTSTNSKTGELIKSFGKFHVLLRKENSKWKIRMDADTGEGASEEVFSKAAPLE